MTAGVTFVCRYLSVLLPLAGAMMTAGVTFVCRYLSVLLPLAGAMMTPGHRTRPRA